METKFNIYTQIVVNGQTSLSLIGTATMDELVAARDNANQQRDRMIEVATIAQKKVDLATEAAKNNQTDIIMQ
jgi:hypothetical protein